MRSFRDLDPSQTPGVGIGNTQSMDFFTHHQPFHGFIDELAVYNVALGAQRVQDLYRAGSLGKCKD